MTFPSKQDAWLKWLLIATVVIEFASGVAILWLGPERWPGGLLVVAAFFVEWLRRTTYYVVEPNELTIHSGPFRWGVPLAAIDQIAPTRNPLSSPALSLDRVRIDYHLGTRHRAIMISPLDRNSFYETIITYVPELKIAGDKVVRRESKLREK